MGWPKDAIAEVERVPVRLWASSAQMQELFGLPERRLLELARLGACRWVKLSPEKQARRLYHVGDMNEYLLSHAGEVLGESEGDTSCE